jgi:hypothetical protein
MIPRSTPLFIPTPNQASEEGDIRDAWMPNPACTDFERFEFVGRLMSGAIQSQESLGVRGRPAILGDARMNLPVVMVGVVLKLDFRYAGHRSCGSALPAFRVLPTTMHHPSTLRSSTVRLFSWRSL